MVVGVFGVWGCWVMGLGVYSSAGPTSHVVSCGGLWSLLNPRVLGVASRQVYLRVLGYEGEGADICRYSSHMRVYPGSTPRTQMTSYFSGSLRDG